MIEMFLALLILAAAVYMMYRLATDPAAALTPVAGDGPADSDSLEYMQSLESDLQAAAKQDGSIETISAAPAE